VRGQSASAPANAPSTKDNDAEQKEDVLEPADTFKRERKLLSPKPDEIECRRYCIDRLGIYGDVFSDYRNERQSENREDYRQAKVTHSPVVLPVVEETTGRTHSYFIFLIAQAGGGFWKVEFSGLDPVAHGFQSDAFAPPAPAINADAKIKTLVMSETSLH
jgi:hypothetical protein